VSCHNAIIHTALTLLHTMGRAQSERLADVVRGVHHGDWGHRSKPCHPGAGSKPTRSVCVDATGP
jgi:hypothetical protein